MKITLFNLPIIILFSIKATDTNSSLNDTRIKPQSNTRNDQDSILLMDLKQFSSLLLHKKNVEEYRIPNTLPNQKYALDSIQFLQVFQHFTAPPPKNRGECGCTFDKQVFYAQEFLYSYNGKVKGYTDSTKFDLITVLTKTKDTSRIYYLTYADDIYQRNGHKMEKGDLTNDYLSPILAEKAQNDSIQLESYATFIDEFTIKKTTLTQNLINGDRDSTIQIFGLSVWDLPVLYDWAEYKNGELVEDFSDRELRSKLNY